LWRRAARQHDRAGRTGNDCHLELDSVLNSVVQENIDIVLSGAAKRHLVKSHYLRCAKRLAGLWGRLSRNGYSTADLKDGRPVCVNAFDPHVEASSRLGVIEVDLKCEKDLRMNVGQPLSEDPIEDPDYRKLPVG
jgi:hypothetical protein